MAVKPKKTVKAKHPGGRPTKYTDKVSKEICRRIANGESLNRICFSDHLPTKTTVFNWLDDERYEKFLDKYTHARVLQSDTFMDQCVDIADDTANDTITSVGKDGEEYEKVNHEHINRSRLKIDTRIKVAEKMAPRKYSPQQRMEHTGADGKELFPQLDPIELAKLAEIMGK